MNVQLKVNALSLVARTLGSTLTDLRGRGLRLRYAGCVGGDHIVIDHMGRKWRVDLVLGAAMSTGV